MTTLTCPVCPHHCRLNPGQTGLCRARANQDDQLVCLNYGRLTSLALDPIEKKPLACFYPGSMILSAGSFGCNMDCPFCQNDSISMAAENEVPVRFVPPETLAGWAVQLKDKGNIGVAYTYNEPLTGFEYVRDTAEQVRALGMKNVLVTNGCFCRETLDEVLPWIDAYNIDLKCFTEEFYQKLGGDLETVKEFISTAARRAHVEVTTLIVPGCNDSAEEIRELSRWLAGVGKDIPLHITRFFPRRKMLDRRPTDTALLYRLAAEAQKSLSRVFVGNV